MTWRDDALCREIGPEWFDTYPWVRGSVHVARQVCRKCPVQAECLEDALVEEYGLPRDCRQGVRAGTLPATRARMQAERDGGAA